MTGVKRSSRVDGTSDGPITEPTMWCHACEYPLDGLSEQRCPECGRPFDPLEKRTYRSKPPGSRRALFVWLVPAMWVPVTVLSFFHSGDEHALFGLGAIAGTWIGFLRRFDSIGHGFVAALLCGIVTLGFLGFVMDRLRVSKRLFFGLFVVGVCALFMTCLGSYVSIAKMVAKHGSVLAVILFDCNGSIYISVVLSIIAAAIRRCWGARTTFVSG